MTTFVKDYEKPIPFGAGWKQLWQNRLEHACFLLSISDGIERVLPRVLQLCKSANDLVEYYETAPPVARAKDALACLAEYGIELDDYLLVSVAKNV